MGNHREYEDKDFENMGGYNGQSHGAKIEDMLRDAGMGRYVARFRGINGGGPFGQVHRSTIPGTTPLAIGGGGSWTAIGASALRQGTIDLIGSNQGTSGRGNVELVGWEGRTEASPRAQLRTVRETYIGKNGYRTEASPRAQLRNVRETYIGQRRAGVVPPSQDPSSSYSPETQALIDRGTYAGWEGRTEASPRAQLRTVRETYIGHKRNASKLLGMILGIASGEIRKRVKSGKSALPPRTVSARLVNRYLEVWKDTYRTRFAKAPAASEVVNEKNRVLGLIAKKGGTVFGQVSVVGDWVMDAGKFLGGTVAKTAEVAARMTWGAGKLLIWDIPKTIVTTGFKGIFYDPIKKTFFKKSGGKAVQVNNPELTALPADYYTNPNVPRRSLTSVDVVQTPSTAAMAARIARRKGLNKRQQAELASRIELAKNKVRLAELERAEMDKVNQLENEAAAAEAEAAQAEADVTEQESGQVSGHLRPSKVASLIGQAQEARIASQILKAAGPFAKMAILASPFRAGVIAAGKIFADAKKDPHGKEKVAALKEAQKAGDPEAEKILDILKLGKNTTEQLQAAKIAETELLKKAAEKEGTAPSVVGMLPSSETVIVAMPGAKMVYQKAKAGDERMLALVRESAKILRGVEAGDQTSKATLTYIQRMANLDPADTEEKKRAKKSGQLGMAAMAVAAAGIREERASASAKRPVAKEAKRIEAKAARSPWFKPNPFITKTTHFLSTLTSADKHAAGTQLKIAQGRAA